LLFNQWKRLRPFYLPTGGLLFLAIAAPWHVLASLRDPEWARFYFVHEHWERFTTTEHGRFEPWWYFLPVVLFGLFPWTTFLWPALRNAVRGGWKARQERADAWFLIVWAGFVFLFFSKSQSKLVPYVLPLFPPLAAMIGAWFAQSAAESAPARVRWWVRGFAVLAVALAFGMLVAVFKPDAFPNARVAELRDNAIAGSIALVAGALAAPWLCRTRGARAAFVAVALASVGLVIALAHAQDELARPGTRELAGIVRARALPDDRVYHYREFFHDFVFYGERLVGTVDFKGEIETQIDPAARASGRFIDEAELRRQWNGPGRIWVVARKKDLTALFGDPAFRYYVIGEEPRHVLFSNRP
jgi:4-amino-4-deoxy-L-arabinose transferase-like glycosyltransferase